MLQGKTGSGNIVVKADNFQYSADLETGSGDVIVNVAKKPNSLAVDFQAGSGEGKIE